MRAPSPATLALLLCVAPLVGACSDGEVAGGAGTGAPARPAVVETRSFERLESEAARALRRDLDLGRLDDASARLAELRDALGVEADLLAARLAAFQGQDVEVLRRLETARTAAPQDPRVYATAAELSAAAGRLETAAAELRRGMEAAGLTPELLRAQGVVELCQSGGAKRGLELLERARGYDAELPFTERPRAQAHLLLAKSALSEARPKAALEAVRRSLELDPKDVDARLFLADVLAALQDFEGAVRVLEALNGEGYGRDVELAEMYKRAALGALLEHRRDQALEYFRLARLAGLDDEQLGSGAQILADAAVEAMEQGVHAYEAGDLATARLRFEHAVHLDDSLLVAHNHLAVVLFQQREFLPAATQWRLVLDQARAEGLELPEPVHVFLAKALYAADEQGAAKQVLQDYLEREPEGEYRETTEALLSELE
ncbi:MAG: tetratricopeptide repeat protein [Planctomycetes bacterium]|nr:tetratricopeptide repeat protein [Planctomycetota bacterium]